MGISLHSITNWPQYNKSLINRGSLTFWVDAEAMNTWFHHGHYGCRGRSQLYTDQTICTFLMLKGIFNLTLLATQGLLDSLFELMNVPLCAPDYSCVSKRARTVTVAYRQPPKGRITDLVIDSTGLKVFGEGEWKVRKHGAEKRRVWRKLHLAVDPVTHDIVAAEVSLENVHDAEVLPTLLNPLRRKLGRVYADGAYDSKASHQLIAHKGATPCIPPRKNAGRWEKGHPRNEAVLVMRKEGLAHWKKASGYHRRSLAETAMYRFKQLQARKISLRNYNGQVGEVMAYVHIPVENEHLFWFKMNADSGLCVHRFRTPQSMYGDGIHLTVAHKREWSYGFKPDNKTVPLPCYPESPYDHQRESSTSQTQPARACQRAQ